MLVGLNLDLWSNTLVDKAVSEFGRLLAWEEDPDHMSRILVRARVFSLDAIPWFFTFSEGTTPETDSWSVQCEVLQATLLGAMPQDEDQPPENPDLLDDFNPEHFEFFGFGQPGQGPPFQPPADAFGHNADMAQGLDWDLWPNPPQQDQAPVEFQPNPVVQEPEEDEVAPQLIPLQHEPIPEVIQQLPAPEDNLVADEIFEGEVLAMDDLTDQSEGEPPLPPFVVEPVQIVDFPNFDNLQPLVPDEIQIEDLLGFINPEDEHYQAPFN
jgi:hypothetical protein